MYDQYVSPYLVFLLTSLLFLFPPFLFLPLTLPSVVSPARRAVAVASRELGGHRRLLPLFCPPPLSLSLSGSGCQGHRRQGRATSCCCLFSDGDLGQGAGRRRWPPSSRSCHPTPTIALAIPPVCNLLTTTAITGSSSYLMPSPPREVSNPMQWSLIDQAALPPPLFVGDATTKESGRC